MNRIIAVSVLVITTSIGVKQVFAQSAKVVNANKKYEKFLYNSAIYKYEGAKSNNDKVLRNQANAYYKVRNSKKAEVIFEKLNSSGNATADDLWKYADVLKMNGKYDEAITVLDAMNKISSDEIRVKAHLEDRKYYTKLQNDKGEFTLKNLVCNSFETEYATNYYNGQVIIVSSRPVYSATAYHDNWSNRRFTNLFTSNEKNVKKGPSLTRIEPVQVLGSITNRYHEGPATFSADGRIMIFTRNSYAKKDSLNKQGVRVAELWMSKKGVHNQWQTPTPLSINNKEYNVEHASISPDGKTLYFVSDMPGGKGGFDLYKVSITSDGNITSAPENIDFVNTEANEMFPFIHENGMLYFASDGHPGLGGLDVFCVSSKGGKVANLGVPVNSQKDDFSFFMNASMTKGYVSSNRDGGKGMDDIYEVTMLKPMLKSKVIEGTIRDQNSKSGLANVTIKILDDQGNTLKETTTNESGYFSLDAEPDMNYKVVASLSNYRDADKQINTSGDAEKYNADLDLMKKMGISLSCYVSENKTGKPLDNTMIRITDNKTGKEIYNARTDNTGRWKENLNDVFVNSTLDYQIFIEREGYLHKTLDWKYTVKKEGEINLHEFLDFTLGKLEVGQDLGKLLSLQPIYFDIGKWDIRQDAAHELDKIVAIMQEYPNVVIELDSHTDCSGSVDANHKLSQKRADASVQYIISKGIPSSRISGKGFGEDRPVNDCKCTGNTFSCSEEEMQMNRRTEFVVVKMSN